MDLNLVVLSGRLAAPPETRTFDSGGRLVRYLVTCRSGDPKRRVDVVPVTWWDPPRASTTEGQPGTAIWVAGTAQRRFWSQDDSRRSRLEIVADQVCLRPPEQGTAAH